MRKFEVNYFTDDEILIKKRGNFSSFSHKEEVNLHNHLTITCIHPPLQVIRMIIQV